MLQMRKNNKEQWTREKICLLQMRGQNILQAKDKNQENKGDLIMFFKIVLRNIKIKY